jgi:hypothetical protein
LYAPATQRLIHRPLLRLKAVPQLAEESVVEVAYGGGAAVTSSALAVVGQGLIESGCRGACSLNLTGFMAPRAACDRRAARCVV